MSYNPNNPNGQATMANSAPVVIASDQTSVPIDDNGGSITVDGTVNVGNFPATQPISGTVTANAGTGTFAVSAASLPLPSGAATSAKQPALGTAGTASVDVITVQGIASMTALKVDGSAVTQPISGSVSVSNFPATQPISGTVAATQSGTWSVGVNNGAGASAVNIQDGGNSITIDGSVSVSNFPATQAISGTVTANAGTGNFTVVQSTAANLNATVTGTVNADTELPTAAILTDTNANPTTPIVGSALLGYNATIWERIRTAASVDGNGAITYTGVLATKNTPKRLDPAALGTAINSASSSDVDGSSGATLSISTTTTGTFIIEGTGDNTNWISLEVFDIASDLWVSGQSLTPTAGKIYGILCAGMRQIRIRTNATLGATVTHYWVLDESQDFIAGIDTGAAPHNFGYSNIHKDGEYSTAQTGTALWTPASGKKFVVTDITITTGGTTAGIVTLWQGSAADTTYTIGTDPAVFRGEFAPSANTKPGVVKSFNVPYVSTTADHILRVTTSAAMTVYIQCNGYEI